MATKTKGAFHVDVSEGKERILITTAGGLVYEITISDDAIQVFSSTSFGSGLVIKPAANNKIILTQDRI